MPCSVLGRRFRVHAQIFSSPAARFGVKVCKDTRVSSGHRSGGVAFKQKFSKLLSIRTEQFRIFCFSFRVHCEGTASNLQRASSFETHGWVRGVQDFRLLWG